MLGEKFDEFFSLCLLQQKIFLLMCGRSDMLVVIQMTFSNVMIMFAPMRVIFSLNVTLILVLLQGNFC